MKTLLVSTALAALTGSHVFAQLPALPPPSSSDSNNVQDIGLNAGPTHWEDPSTLGHYRLSSDGNVPLPSGLVWSSSQSAGMTASLAALDTPGGTIRSIFTGETAGWLNDFGYTFSGNPAGPDSFTVFSDIQTVGSATVSFGDHVDISLLPHEVGTFDFWLNASDSFTTANPPPPTTNGGVYTVFHPTNSDPYLPPGNVKFAQAPLLVSTWLPTLNMYLDVPTYLVAIEDWRSDRGADQDTSDLIVALQFFLPNGNPSGGGGAVPEPSTYSLTGALVLFGLAALRRKRLVDQSRKTG